MVGDVLYPLNTLRQLYPLVYEREMIKYQDHPHSQDLQTRRIPKLNCLWHDVIHCSAIHPNLLYRALKERDLPVRAERTFFQIPLASLQAGQAVVLQTSIRDDPAAPIDDEAVNWLDFTTYRELALVPPNALEWYDQLTLLKRTIGLFVGVPLILIPSPISIKQSRVISWAEALVPRSVEPE
jgi:hypothetical protein